MPDLLAPDIVTCHEIGHGDTQKHREDARDDGDHHAVLERAVIVFLLEELLEVGHRKAVDLAALEGVDDDGGEGPDQEERKDHEHHQLHPEPGVHVKGDGDVLAFQHVITSSDSAS